MTSTYGRPEDRPSLGDLVSSLSEKLSALVRDEIRLAKAEMAEKGKHAATGLGLFAGAALLGFFAFGVLITTAILGLANVLAPWLAALIVGIVLLAVAAVLALLGKKALAQGTPPTPDKAQASMKQDVEALKEGLHR